MPKGNRGIVRKTLADAFWPKVRKGDGCWEWTGHLKPGTPSSGGGYGVLSRLGRAKTAHRISWEMHFGTIPSGMGVCHHCDNRRCVRPDHLFLGTAKDNLRDACKKGRFVPHLRKLKVAHVRAIRAGLACGTHPEALAARYGVTRQAINSIRRGHSYGWLDGGADESKLTDSTVVSSGQGRDLTR